MIPVHVAVERSTKSVVADNTIIPLMLEMQTLITHLYGNNMEVDGQAAMHPIMILSRRANIMVDAHGIIRPSLILMGIRWNP